MFPELFLGALCGLGAAENDLDFGPQPQRRAGPYSSITPSKCLALIHIPDTVLSVSENYSKPSVLIVIIFLVAEEESEVEGS